MVKLYQFNPDESITTYELALIMKEIMIILINSLNGVPASVGDDKLEIEQITYDKLSANIKKHFK